MRIFDALAFFACGFACAGALLWLFFMYVGYKMWEKS